MKDASWGKVAEWYDQYLEDGEDTYQRKVILPNLLRLLEINEGEEVLDLACGQGFFSRELARLGAVVTGVDISVELISMARLNLAKGATFREPTYYVSPAHQLSFLKDASMDKAVMALALQNIENYQEVLKETARVLKQDGSLYIVLNHPAFRVPQASQWGFDEKRSVQYRRVDRYLSELKIFIQMHPGSRPASKTLSFHRPLQSYFKAFNKAGFAVSRLEEWVSHKKSEKGTRAKAEDSARAEIPLFLFIQAEKNKPGF